MTLAWMERLSEVFGVSPQEIVWAPPALGLRKVRVKGALQAGHWNEGYEWDEDQQYDVMIPDDLKLKNLKLYAAEVRGESMNLRYQPGSVVVLSEVRSGLDLVREGLRYHVKQTRADGDVEETIKTLVKDQHGKFWLKPESTMPEFQQWISLEGADGTNIELVGRVRFTVQREDD